MLLGGGGGVLSNHSYTASCGRGGLVDWGPTHVVKEATSRRWDTPTGKHLRTGIRRAAWRTLGGRGEWWGKPPNEQPDLYLVGNNCTRLITSRLCCTYS